MFFGLFGVDSAGVVSTCMTESEASTKTNITCPPLPRPSTGLCGIENRGATCYLNSLLQTLLFTPEFRESLFALSPAELGKLEDESLPDSKVRVIPIHLQRLFARLLLSNQQSLSTVELTDSFGWTNSEEMQQHDVQELNRILFCAVEDSLVGTSGQTLISKLYRGTVVNKIICDDCGRVSEREEEFLDLSIPVTTSNFLESALYDMYVAMETLDGNNQYRCERCARLVNAKKGAKIRSLPPVLTISLLRFSFDFVKLERYKETRKFIFPHELDMSPYCESDSHSEYELFSVVIHQGSTHGGHYHVYIRDVDSLGHWTPPEKELIQIPSDPSVGKLDFINCDSPVDLLVTLLTKSPTEGVVVDRLCADLVKQTGVSWNKRFKKQYGTINKFIKKYDETFSYDEVSRLVQLNSEQKTNSIPAAQEMDGENSSSDDKQSAPPIGHCWFDFNDSRVHPVTTNDIENQYAGRESAYMLFYRNKTMKRPQEALQNYTHAVPQVLIDMTEQENKDLDLKREEYDEAVNRLELKVHFSKHYEFANGALQLKNNETSPLTITLDRRKTVTHLKDAINSEIPGEEWSCVHVMRHKPAGVHLYDCLTGDDEAVLKDLCVANGDEVFCWDGKQVDGKNVLTGSACEPVLLDVVHCNSINDDPVKIAFPKCITLQDMCNILQERLNFDPQLMHIRKKVVKEEIVQLIQFDAEDTTKTLEELDLNDGTCLCIQETSSSAGKIISISPSTVNLSVENRLQVSDGCPSQQMQLEIKIEKIVEELKALAVSSFSVSDDIDCRLRIDDKDFGLKQPLHEQQTVSDAGIKSGTTLILEAGLPPSHNQVCLSFGWATQKDTPNLEVILDKNCAVGQCVVTMTKMAELAGDWHLRKTNWCGEEDAILDDLDLTLEQYSINDGSHLLLKEGSLPPKGQLRLPIWLYTAPQMYENMNDWITNYLNSLFGETSESRQPQEGSESKDLIDLGTVDLERLCTLQVLKERIMCLLEGRGTQLPSIELIRVRLMDKKRPTTVLRNLNQTLQRLKVNNSSNICIQMLTEKEELQPNQLLLNVCLRQSSTRTYETAKEVVWEISKGPSIECLRKRVAEIFTIPSEHVSVAKHFSNKFEWLEINKQGACKFKKKGGKQCNINLKHAPYYIQDGDTIGVKDLREECKTHYHDFSTASDEAALEQLRREMEEKKQMRKNKKNQGGVVLSDSSKKTDRPEVGISIKVGNFK